MEIFRFVTWLDRTAARTWVSLRQSPAWYAVTIAGSMAFVLTSLLFFSSISNNDPTLGELASSTRLKAVVSRASMEAEGHWAAQDKWRIAHLFLQHRAPKSVISQLVHDDIADEAMMLGGPPSQFTTNRTQRISSRVDRPMMQAGHSNLPLPVPDVRLDLNRPRRAEKPKRLVDYHLVRETDRPIRLAAGYRSRESTLLVQAEFESASECYTEPPRHPITRRPIPVPDPRWDDLPAAPLDHRQPKLDFTVSMLREFLPATSEFPPHSQIGLVTGHSKYPEISRMPRRSNPFDGADSPWIPTRTDRISNDSEESYAGQGGLRDANSEEQTQEEFQHKIRRDTVPSFAEVALRLEMEVPKTAALGGRYRSSLQLQNDGEESIAAISIREPYVSRDTLSDALPPARIHADEKIVERKLYDLESGQSHRVQLVWLPNSEGEQVHVARVKVETFVGSSTEISAPKTPVQSQPADELPDDEPFEQRPARIVPEPVRVREPDQKPQPISIKKPGLSFDVRSRPRALVDDLVEIQIMVRNTGDVPLHQVRVQAELPKELSHRQGREVEYVVRELPIGGSEVAVLRVTAESTGKAVCRLAAFADERVEAKTNTVVDVDPKPVRVEAPRERPAPVAVGTKPVSPTPIAAAPIIKQPMPAVPKASPNAGCCCQSQPAPLMFDPWYGP